MLLIFLYLRSCEIGNDQLGFLQVKENSHGNNFMVLIRNSGSLIVFLWFLRKRQGHKVQLPAEMNRDLCSFHEHYKIKETTKKSIENEGTSVSKQIKEVVWLWGVSIWLKMGYMKHATPFHNRFAGLVNNFESWRILR